MGMPTGLVLVEAAAKVSRRTRRENEAISWIVGACLHRSVRIHGRIKLMTTNQVGPGSGVDRDYFYFPGDGFGYGLGFGVRTDPGNAKPAPPGSLGELKWDGASGCYLVIDRKQDMFFVLLEQSPSERQKIQPTVKRLIYEALEN
jgi:CubicO group peptidase (beta-lactamase class C family)